MVRVLRAAGQNEEAARLGQEAVTAGGRDGELYRETELALIALDRYDAALALEDRAGKQAVAHPEIALEAGYLAGREDRVTSALATIGKMTEDAVLLEQARAVYLDNTGAAAEGRATWSDAARTGECSVATQLARVAASRAAAGPEARADAALAGALCGDSELAGESKNDARVRAAVSMAQGEPEAAALALTGLRDGGTEPVTQFLKGMSHLQSGNAQAAVQDFQAIVKHRGSSYETGIDLGPAAQLKLARAFAEAGERSRSMEAYRDFLKLWDAAGAGDRLRVEAAAGARGSLPVGEPAVPPVQMANARTGEQQRRPVSDRPRVKSYFPTPAWLMPSDGGAGSSGQGVGAAKAMPAGGKSPRDASGTTIE
jgi:tetratricopeptide (TPR) repeat protein